MEPYLTRFGDDPTLKGAVASTFNGESLNLLSREVLIDRRLIQEVASSDPQRQDGSWDFQLSNASRSPQNHRMNDKWGRKRTIQVCLDPFQVA